MEHIIFALNPGSTSTKTALFRNDQSLIETSVHHDTGLIHSFSSVMAQLPMRMAAVSNLQQVYVNQFLDGDPSRIDAYVGRGGLTHPITGGTYLVNDDMLQDLQEARYGEHAANLGAGLIHQLAKTWNKPAYVVDPPTVDELIELARITGLPQIRRKSIFHALNQKAIARLVAADMAQIYEEMDMIVAHMGGGISVGAHRHGQVIDVNNAMEDGPMSPERAGSLPSLQLCDLIGSGRYDPAALRKMLVGQGGLVAWTGTNDARQIEAEMQDNPLFENCLSAMAYQIAKQIGAMAVSLQGKQQVIVLTGGLARSTFLVTRVIAAISFLAPVRVIPGEKEMSALAAGALRVLRQQENPRQYQRVRA